MKVLRGIFYGLIFSIPLWSFIAYAFSDELIQCQPGTYIAVVSDPSCTTRCVMQCPPPAGAIPGACMDSPEVAAVKGLYERCNTDKQFFENRNKEIWVDYQFFSKRNEQIWAELLHAVDVCGSKCNGIVQ